MRVLSGNKGDHTKPQAADDRNLSMLTMALVNERGWHQQMSGDEGGREGGRAEGIRNKQALIYMVIRGEGTASIIPLEKRSRFQKRGVARPHERVPESMEAMQEQSE